MSGFEIKEVYSLLVWHILVSFTMYMVMGIWLKDWLNLSFCHCFTIGWVPALSWTNRYKQPNFFVGILHRFEISCKANANQFQIMMCAKDCLNPHWGSDDPWDTSLFGNVIEGKYSNIHIFITMFWAWTDYWSSIIANQGMNYMHTIIVFESADTILTAIVCLPAGNSVKF